MLCCRCHQLSCQLRKDIFTKAFLNPCLSDVTFFVGNRLESDGPVDKSKLLRVPGHKCVIAQVSPKFERMFADHLKQRTEVIIDDVSPVDFVSMLSYIYTNRVDNCNIRCSLLLASCRYELFGMFRSLYQVYRLNNEKKQSLSEENCLFMLHHLEEIQQLNMPKWMRLIKSIASKVSFRFWCFHAYKVMSPLAMEMWFEINQNLFSKPSSLFDFVFLWAKYRCICQQANHQVKPEQVRSTIGDLIFKIPLPFLTLNEIREGPLASGIFADNEIDKFIQRFSIEGPIAPKDDAFLGRFDCLIEYPHVTYNIRFLGGMGMKKEIEIRDFFFTDQVHIQLNTDAVLTGFVFYDARKQDTVRKKNINKLYSVCLLNEQGQTLYNKRSLSMTLNGNFMWNSLIDPIRLLANHRYILSATLLMDQQRLTVRTDYPVQCEWTQPSSFLTTHCPMTLSDACFYSLKFLRFD